MAIELEDRSWWRERRLWHLGWADYEAEWIRRGRPFPEHWEYHREGSQWAGITYADVRECWAADHPKRDVMLWRNTYGSMSVHETCLGCGEKLTSALGNKKLRELGLDRDDLLIANTGREAKEECARCASTEAVEYHHWAPKHLFPHDADTWPGSYLCRLCHNEWHRVVTPKMNQRKTA
jgi:hypothetical protein